MSKLLIISEMPTWHVTPCAMVICFSLYTVNSVFNTKKISCFCTDGKISVRINLPLFSTVVPASIFMFLSCRPFVAITLSTGLVGVEVTSVAKEKILIKVKF